MSDDWEGLGSEDGGYSEYLGSPAPQVPPLPTAPPPTPVGPLISPLTAVPPFRSSAGGPSGPVRTSPNVSTVQLGDFSPTAICELRTLTKLSYLFVWNIANGDTGKALSVLGVFRFLFNDSRARIVSGFSSAAQAILPVSLSTVAWDQPTQRALVLSVSATLGATNAAMQTALGNMPSNMAALAGWFPSFRAALAPGDTAITDYANSPINTATDYGTQIAGLARDDLAACLTPPAVAATPPGAAPPTYTAAAGPGASSSLPIANRPQTSSGGAAPAAASGGSNFIALAMLALVGYGAYLTFKDGKKQQSLGALPPGSSWLPRDLGTKAAEFERLNQRAQKAGEKDARVQASEVSCIPGDRTRKTFSMDEWGGPAAERLNRAIFALSESVHGATPDRSHALRRSVEHELEDTYFKAYVAGLHAAGVRGGTCE